MSWCETIIGFQRGRTSGEVALILHELSSIWDQEGHLHIPKGTSIQEVDGRQLQELCGVQTWHWKINFPCTQFRWTWTFKQQSAIFCRFSFQFYEPFDSFAIENTLLCHTLVLTSSSHSYFAKVFSMNLAYHLAAAKLKKKINNKSF